MSGSQVEKNDIRPDRPQPAECLASGFSLDDIELAEGQERLLDKIAVPRSRSSTIKAVSNDLEASKSRSLSKSHCLGTGSEHARSAPRSLPFRESPLDVTAMTGMPLVDSVDLISLRNDSPLFPQAERATIAASGRKSRSADRASSSVLVRMH